MVAKKDTKYYDNTLFGDLLMSVSGGHFKKTIPGTRYLGCLLRSYIERRKRNAIRSQWLSEWTQLPFFVYTEYPSGTPN